MFVFLAVSVEFCLVNDCGCSPISHDLIKDIKKYVFYLQFWNKGVSIHVAQGRVRRVCVNEMSATAGKTNSVGRLRRLRRVVSH